MRPQSSTATYRGAPMAELEIDRHMGGVRPIRIGVLLLRKLPRTRWRHPTSPQADGAAGGTLRLAVDDRTRPHRIPGAAPRRRGSPRAIRLQPQDGGAAHHHRAANGRRRSPSLTQEVEPWKTPRIRSMGISSASRDLSEHRSRAPADADEPTWTVNAPSVSRPAARFPSGRRRALDEAAEPELVIAPLDQLPAASPSRSSRSRRGSAQA